MPDKNVQLPDGRIVAFPDSMADADISAVIKKQLISAQPDRQHTLLNMTAAMSGQPQQTPEDQARFEAGKKAGAVSAAETTGGVLGGEAAAGLKGLTGALLRVLGTSAGAGAGNVAGQVGTSGHIDPIEALKSAATWGTFAGVGEFVGALGDVRNALRDLMFSPEGKVTPFGKAVAHPLDAGSEFALRKTLGAPDAPVKPVKGESVPITKSPNFDPAAYKEGVAARTTQPLPEPVPPAKPSPFAGATSSSFNDLKIPAAKIETDSLGIRWAVDENGLRVSIPKNISDAEAGKYATAKLAEQKSILSDIKSRTAPAWNVQSGAKSPFTSTGMPPEAVGGDLTGQDLINRTKKIVVPGKAVTADDLKRAGDLTQVPLDKLKQLASWGDELAKNEIVRRLRQ